MSEQQVETKMEDIPLADAESKPVATDVEKGATSDTPEEAVPLKKKKRRNVVQDMRKLQKEQTRLSSVIYNSLYGMIGLCLANIVHIICIIIGSVYVQDCPISTGIPIVLIVNGAINLSISLLDAIKAKFTIKNTLIKIIDVLLYILRVALVGAFIAWIVIVFKVECPNHHDTWAPNYCHKTVYKSAYWFLILAIFVSFFTCCCSCCCGAFKLCGEGCSAAAKDVVAGGDQQPEKPNKAAEEEKPKPENESVPINNNPE